MTDKELRRLSRADLLEMMLSLSKENEVLRKKVEQLQKERDDRTIAIENAGSLAEAALKLNGVFEAAQAACEQYTQNIRWRSENQEQICMRMEQETREKCAAMLRQAEAQAGEILKQAKISAREKDDSYSWLMDLMNETKG